MRFLPFKLVAIYKISPPLPLLNLSSETELTWTLTSTFEKLRERFDTSLQNNLD